MSSIVEEFGIRTTLFEQIRDVFGGSIALQSCGAGHPPAAPAFAGAAADPARTLDKKEK